VVGHSAILIERWNQYLQVLAGGRKNGDSFTLKKTGSDSRKSETGIPSNRFELPNAI